MKTLQEAVKDDLLDIKSLLRPGEKLTISSARPIKIIFYGMPVAAGAENVSRELVRRSKENGK